MLIIIIVITSCLLIFGIIKLTGDNDQDFNNTNKQEEKTENNEQEGEGEHSFNLEENKKVPQKEVENTRKIEEKLGLGEEDLKSHTELQNEIAEIENNGGDVKRELKNSFGEMVELQYEDNLSIKEDYGDYELNQLALRFPQEIKEDEYIYYKLKPKENLNSPVYGDKEINETLIYGEENVGKGYNADDKPRYFKDVEGFKDFGDGIDLGYISLENDEEGFKFKGLGLSDKQEEKYSGYVVTLNVKLDGEIDEEDVRDKINSIYVNGHKGIDLYDDVVDENSFIYIGDSILEVEIPLKDSELFKKNESKKVEEFDKGNLDTIDVDINGEKVKLDKISLDDYKQGIYLN